MNKSIAIFIGLLIVLVLVGFNTTYSVNFHEVAIKTRFGKPVEVIREAGLHFKAPFFIDQITKLDTRKQLVDSPLETVLTKDGQQVLVKAFMLWQIEDVASSEADQSPVLEFFNSYESIDRASSDLEQQLQGALRLMGGVKFDELIGKESNIGNVEQTILADLRSTVKNGIEPVTVGISRIVLPESTSISVLRRMASVQSSLAQAERVRGSSVAENLESQARTQADTIRNFASQWASRIESQGNEQADRFYQEMQKEAQLAILLAWRDTLRASLTGNTTFVTDTTRAPFHMLDLDAPTNQNGMPVPVSSYGEPQDVRAEDKGGS
jgi:regulator of protease activity HflC (stomatin/prohibitin superfamily)